MRGPGEDVLHAAIGGRYAGVLVRRRGRLTWRYDPGYPPDATPLSVRAPVEPRTDREPGVGAWIEGLLPDNRDVRAVWARQQGVRDTPFTLLGTGLGLDVAGAVSFSRDPAALTATVGGAEPVSEGEIAELCRGMGRDRARWVASPEVGRFSLAGAQAKTALMRTRDGWLRPYGSWGTSHIIKPPSPEFPEHHINEYMCMVAADRVGLVCAGVELARFEDQPALVVERYDRVGDGEHYARVHQEDMCQALGLHPTTKYESDGGPGASEMLGVLGGHVPPEARAQDMARLVDAQIFNWIIAATDAHAKNYSLLLDGPVVRLAPLYDLASGLSHWSEREIKVAMRVGDSYQALPPHGDPWPGAATSWGVPAHRVAERLISFARDIPEAFAWAADTLARDGWHCQTASILTERVTARAEGITRRLS